MNCQKEVHSVKNKFFTDKLICLAIIGAKTLSASAQSSQVERKAWLLLWNYFAENSIFQRLEGFIMIQTL